eukprot:TRINITY_DN29873_c0_g1_i1.p1 TRINITY_DN29873_c0_g1~~TRINITY_DN29873_c0_g1_i1.p1  ORF type:complete len:574 (-),score=159.76 TRINITY_DN29873_c0_g1_i1:66-1787(-)
MRAGDAGACREHGNVLLKAGDLQEAWQTYTVGLRLLEPDALARGDAEAVALRANRALAALRLGRFDEALDDSETALRGDPRHSKAAFRRGQALLGLGRHRDAAKALAALARREPGNAEVRKELARAEEAVAQAVKGEFDFRAMLEEASQAGRLRLERSAPGHAFCNLEALQRGEAGSWRARRLIHAGELLLATLPLVFVRYDELGNQQVLVERVLQAAEASPETATRLRELLPRSGAALDEGEARELLLRSCAACATGVGVWHGCTFFQHADEPNACRAFVADWAFVRCSRDIQKGEPVTLSYIDPTADYKSQLLWLQGLGIHDEALASRAERWEAANVEEPPELAAIRRALCVGIEPGDDAPSTALEERTRYLDRCRGAAGISAPPASEDAEAPKLWCWGALVRWLRAEQMAAQERGEVQRAIGASLAVGELVERHLGAGVAALEAWADCAALLLGADGPPPAAEGDDAAAEEYGEVLGRCVDAVQRGVDFVFGDPWTEDPDFSTLVLEWATSRWKHSRAWQQHAAEAAEQAARLPAEPMQPASTSAEEGSTSLREPVGACSSLASEFDGMD